MTTTPQPCHFPLVELSDHGTTFDVILLMSLFREESHCGLTAQQLVGLGVFLLLITVGAFFVTGYVYAWYILLPWRLLIGAWKWLFRKGSPKLEDMMLGISRRHIFDLLRAAVAKKTEFGIQIEDAMMRGGLPEDGFPKTPRQANALDAMLAKEGAVASKVIEKSGRTFYRIQRPPLKSVWKHFHSDAMAWGRFSATYISLQQFLVMTLCVFITADRADAFDHFVCAIPVAAVWLCRRRFSHGISLAIVAIVIIGVSIILPDTDGTIANLAGNKTITVPIETMDELKMSEV